MIQHTTGQLKKLQELQDYWDYARNSEMRKTWSAAYIRNLRFHYGDQWSEELKREFEETGALPFAINRVDPIITTYVSLQINSRKRVAIKPTTDLPSHATLAEYVNNLFYNVQAHNDYQTQCTAKYRDALIGGLGWSHIGYDPDSSEPFFIYRVNPLEMFPDPDDQTDRLEEQNVTIRSYFVPAVKLKERYPKFAAYFDSMVDQNLRSADNYYVNNLQDADTGCWSQGKSIRIVEVYYKENTKYYETTVADEPDNPNDPDAVIIERFFSTFDLDVANEKKAEGAEIIQKDGTKICKGVFCENVLLEHGDLYPQIPNQKHFPITPLCLQRNWLGVPYGVVDGLIDLSMALNYIWTKTIHGLGSKFLMVENTPEFDATKHGEKLLNEMRKKIGVVAVKQAKDAQLISSENMLPYLFNALQRVDVEFEQKTQLFDELKGNQTNAVSGVAIQQRAVNAARTQNPLNATYDHMLFSEGQLMLDTLRGIKNFKYAFNYYQDGKVNMAAINDEIATVNFELLPDIAPNFSTSNDEKIARFEALISNPSAALVLSDPLFLEKVGFSQDEAISLNEAYVRVQQGQQQQQQQQEQMAQQAQMEQQTRG